MNLVNLCITMERMLGVSRSKRRKRHFLKLTNQISLNKTLCVPSKLEVKPFRKWKVHDELLDK
jgi:hypothetical protein